MKFKLTSLHREMRYIIIYDKSFAEIECMTLLKERFTLRLVLLWNFLVFLLIYFFQELVLSDYHSLNFYSQLFFDKFKLDCMIFHQTKYVTMKSCGIRLWLILVGYLFLYTYLNFCFCFFAFFKLNFEYI